MKKILGSFYLHSFSFIYYWLINEQIEFLWRVVVEIRYILINIYFVSQFYKRRKVLDELHVFVILSLTYIGRLGRNILFCKVRTCLSPMDNYCEMNSPTVHCRKKHLASKCSDSHSQFMLLPLGKDKRWKQLGFCSFYRYIL